MGMRGSGLRAGLLALSGLASACPLTTFELESEGNSAGAAGSFSGAGGASGRGGAPLGGAQGGEGGDDSPPLMTRPDRYVILQGEELNTLPAGGVLANDTPSQLEVIGFAHLDGSRPEAFDAVVEIDPNGAFHFKPERRFFGVYRIAYTARNSRSETAEETIEVNVVPTDIDLDAVLEGVGGFVLRGGPGEALGVSVASASDLDADGLADLIVGAPGAAEGAGAAYLVFGKLGHEPVELEPLPASTSERRYVSFLGKSGDAAGVSVSAIGDVDGDEVVDLAIGANGGRGRAYVVFTDPFEGGVALPAPRGSSLIGDAANGDVGRVVSGVGDVNGDGSPDVLVSSRNVSYGWIHVVFGSTLRTNASTMRSTPLAEAVGFHVRGAAPDDAFPLAATGAGDVDGDGFAEVLLASHSGFVLLLGGMVYPQDAGSQGPDGTMGGWSLVRGGRPAPGSVAGGADVNADRVPDVAYCDGVIYCRVVFGPPSSLASGWTLEGFARGTTQLLAALGGDLDGDGYSDPVFADDSSAYVVYGKATGHTELNMAALRDAGFSIKAAAGGTITSISLVGDVNGDGLADLAIGDAAALSGSGRVYVVFGVRSR